MKNKNYTRQIIDDYCVLDVETTGFSAYYDEIIEVGILKIRNNKIIDEYSQLIKPEREIDPFVEELRGITNEMVKDMPSIKKAMPEILSFLEDDIIIGHNTCFDMRFLKAGFEQEVENQYMDTLQFARKLFPELEHHRLTDLTMYLGLSENQHRAISDCISTKELYDSIKSIMKQRNLEIKDLWSNCSSRSQSINISSIKPTEVEIDEDSPFYNKHIAFTGKLEKMNRKDAMQIVVNLGGILDSSVTKSTNYLILGDNDYNAILKGKQSAKHKKAQKRQLEGQDIEILDELTFYDIIEN